MTDTAALAALIVAAVALLVAAGQLSQQLLATAYVIRKCDRIVTGGLTKGGWRQWHWRQFRFTVNYQAIVFTLPPIIYTALGISSTIQVDRRSTSNGVHDRAVKTRSQRNSAQGCWVSLVQDLAASGCLQSADIGTSNGSADRIPDDLTVAPVRVDCMTVLLSCIAMGMQVFKYSPTTGEITLGGGTGSISSSVHPILGGILHYSIFANEPMEASPDAKRHGHALRNSKGVWANAVFGRFRDRSYRPEMIAYEVLMERKIPILERHGWPGNNGSDTVGGAASFLVFAHVDVYEMVPPTVISGYAAHFAEVIVKAHHIEILKERTEDDNMLKEKGNHRLRTPPNDIVTQTILDLHGCSSPYLPDNLIISPYAGEYFRPSGPKEFPKASLLLKYEGFLTSPIATSSMNQTTSAQDMFTDPSSYCLPSASWNIICLADNYIRRIYESMQPGQRNVVMAYVDMIMATAVQPLSDIGAPSWGGASETIKSWPEMLDAACDHVLDDVDKQGQLQDDEDGSFRRKVRYCAEFSILRAGYFTIMMRAAQPLGPGLKKRCNIETAMAYMA